MKMIGRIKKTQRNYVQVKLESYNCLLKILGFFHMVLFNMWNIKIQACVIRTALSHDVTPPAILSMQNINIPACFCAKYDRTGEQHITGPEWLCKISTYRPIHVQDWSVPAAAQDMNVPDVVLFDLACTIWCDLSMDWHVHAFDTAVRSHNCNV